MPTQSATGNWSWRYNHGPGLDDSLVAAYTLGGQLAFTDSAGYDYSSPLIQPADYTNNGGNQAGGIERAQRFDNSRAESDQAPGLSFYRNRYYDQTTGRWLTEAPIGIAGGTNLYAYVGNNPATFTDPFGLCPRELQSHADQCIAWDKAIVARRMAEIDRNSRVRFSGVGAKDATGKLGTTFGVGMYCNDEGCGGYLRWGFAKGNTRSLGLETGTSSNLFAFSGWSAGGCGGIGPFGGCITGNAHGTTESIGLSHPGVSRGISGDFEVTHTEVTHPSQLLRLGIMQSCVALSGQAMATLICGLP